MSGVQAILEYNFGTSEIVNRHASYVGYMKIE